MDSAFTPIDTYDSTPDYSAPPVPVELTPPGVIGDEL